MNGLGPDARRLLEDGSNAGEPDDARLARVRGALLGRVGVATAATAVALTIAPSAAAASASGAAAGAGVSKLVAGPAFKALAAFLVAGSVAGAYVYEVNHAAPRPSAAHVASGASTVAAVPVAAPRTVVPEPGAAPPGAPSPKAEPVISTARSVAPPSAAESLASLREAQAALVAGEPSRARRAAERVPAEGPFAEEREGLLALSACGLRLASAATDAARFAARWPESPLTLRVAAACDVGHAGR